MVADHHRRGPGPGRRGGPEPAGPTVRPACAASSRECSPRSSSARSVMAVPATWQAMVRAARNATRAGVAGYAISAVDIALWDLKARVLGAAAGRPARPGTRRRPGLRQRRVHHLRRRRSWPTSSPAGSGPADPAGQDQDRASPGARASDRDLARMRRGAGTRSAAATALFVDANGGYTRQAGGPRTAPRNADERGRDVVRGAGAARTTWPACGGSGTRSTPTSRPGSTAAT